MQIKLDAFVEDYASADLSSRQALRKWIIDFYLRLQVNIYLQWR